ncbi:MAG: hypothetical protein ACPL6D_05545 [Thermodesulfobacteriota bacterium]
MRKIFFVFLGLLLIIEIGGVRVGSAQRGLEIKGKGLISQNPPFTVTLPSEFKWVHSSSFESPRENSLTRVYLYIKEKDRKIEELLIVQIADKTNPQAGPMNLPPLKPYTEKRTYQKDRVKKGELVIDYLIQLMAWNPDAPSLQPIVKKGITIPSQWALQGQFLFNYLGEHAVFFRYSRDVNSFGIKVSAEGRSWEREVISKNEKKALEIFKKDFLEMLNSIQIKPPS